MPLRNSDIDKYHKLSNKHNKLDEQVRNLASELYSWGTDSNVEKLLNDIEQSLDKFECKEFNGTLNYIDMDQILNIEVGNYGLRTGLKAKDTILSLMIPREDFAPIESFIKTNYRTLFKYVKSGITSNIIEQILSVRLNNLLDEWALLTRDPSEEIPSLNTQYIIEKP